jgi:hypothetical protein
MRFLAIFLSVVGALWWSIGMWISKAPLVLYVVPVVMAVLLLTSGFRQGRSLTAGSMDQRRVWSMVGFASAFEGVAIMAAFLYLPAMQSPEVSASVLSIIVGLHFILLANWLRVLVYYITAALLVSLGVTGFAIENPVLRPVRMVRRRHRAVDHVPHRSVSDRPPAPRNALSTHVSTVLSGAMVLNTTVWSPSHIRPTHKALTYAETFREALCTGPALTVRRVDLVLDL